MSDEPHRFKKINGFKWAVCSRCDLVVLKNKATERALARPCVGQYIKVETPEKYRAKELK
jgi:hypothetical protein